MRDFKFDIPIEDPFRNDAFNRKIIAENFMKIFDADEEGIVLSIDSDWGTGKTTFIKMWQTLVSNDNRYKDKYDSIYFNAWDNDYVEDPLIAILTEIRKREKSKDEQTNLAPEIFNEIFTTPYLIAKRAADIAIKYGTAGLFGLNEFKIKEDDNQKEMLKKLNEMGDEVLNRYTHASELRDEFKEKLSLVKEKYNKKLIFFIDELDRCRPSFAIELLETIKHLFSVSGVIFVVSLDKQQLSHSVATIYGQNMDTIGYLRRFFDLEYNIQKPNLAKYIDMKNKNINDNDKKSKYMQIFLKAFMSEFNFSLRDIDRAYFFIEKLIPLISDYTNGLTYKDEHLIATGYLYAYMICMKIKYEGIYKKIINFDYKNDDIKIEQEFKIDLIKNIDFKKANIHDTELPNQDLSKIVFYYLKLGKMSVIQRLTLKKGDYSISVNNFDMMELRYFFNEEGESIINNNLEFISRFK